MLKGILASLAANVLFGAVYYFAILLRPLEGEAMFGFRIVVVIPFILLAIILFKTAIGFCGSFAKNSTKSTACIGHFAPCSQHRRAALAVFMGS